MRYEYEGRVTTVEDAFPENEFDISKTAYIEIHDGVSMRFRVPRKEAGALYGKNVRVIVEVEQ